MHIADQCGQEIPLQQMLMSNLQRQLLLQEYQLHFLPYPQISAYALQIQQIKNFQLRNIQISCIPKKIVLGRKFSKPHDGSQINCIIGSQTCEVGTSIQNIETRHLSDRSSYSFGSNLALAHLFTKA